MKNKTLLATKMYAVLTAVFSFLTVSCYPPQTCYPQRMVPQYQNRFERPPQQCGQPPQFMYPQQQPYGYPQQGYGYQQPRQMPPQYFGSGQYNGGPAMLSYASGGQMTPIIRVGRSAKGKEESKTFIKGLADAFSKRSRT